MTDRRDDAVRLRACALNGVRPELSRAHEHGLHTDALGADDVALEIVADHPGHLRIGVERLARRGEVRRARLSEHDRLDAGGILETRNVGARVELRAALRLPP